MDTMAYPYGLDGFMEELYRRFGSGGEQLLEKSSGAFAAEQKNRRETLRGKLGLPVLEAMACPPVVEEIGTVEYQGCTIHTMGLTILPYLTMPVYKIEPIGQGGDKTFLYCHGHGPGGVRDCFLPQDIEPYHKQIPLKMARRGYTVYTFEPAGFGDFVIGGYRAKKESPCYPLSTQLLMYGITAVGLRVFQVGRLASYMEQQGVRRFAVGGISGGGTVASLFAALDRRPIAAAISCYANTFRDSIMAMHHCVDNFIPGIFALDEMAYVMALALPMPLFLSCGLQDPIYPIEGSRRAAEILKALYGRYAAPDLLEAEFFDGAHEYTEKFIGWLDQRFALETYKRD